jgi:hypothetical protein
VIYFIKSKHEDNKILSICKASCLTVALKMVDERIENVDVFQIDELLMNAVSDSERMLVDIVLYIPLM